MSFYIKKQNSLFINQGFTMFFNNKNGWTAVLQVALIWIILHESDRYWIFLKY